PAYGGEQAARARGAPDPEARLSDMLRDFNAIVADDSKADAFINRWKPQSIVMPNFDQRVAESAYSPDLRLRNGQPGGGSGDHFWFIAAPAQRSGYLLPARSWLQHRSALRGEGAKL